MNAVDHFKNASVSVDFIPSSGASSRRSIGSGLRPRVDGGEPRAFDWFQCIFSLPIKHGWLEKVHLYLWSSYSISVNKGICHVLRLETSENKAPSVSTYQGFYRLGWGMKATFAGNSNAALAYLYQITNNILLAKLLQGRSCIRINYKHLPGMKRSLPSWDWSNYSERKWG